MAIVWQNSFDGTPGTSVTVANSGAHGNPIAGIRNNAPANAVRYGDRAALGASSMRLGLDDGTAHGDVWLYYPTVNAYSISFYVFLPSDGWFRVRDASVITEFYLSSTSQEYVLGNQTQDPGLGANFIDQWMRVEISADDTRMEYRLYWTDIHAPATAAAADLVFSQARAGGTIGGVFTQGGGTASSPTSYIDNVRIGEGEWLGPWPSNHTLSAGAALSLAVPPVDVEAAAGDMAAAATLPLTIAPTTISRAVTTGAAATIGAVSVEATEVTRDGHTPAAAGLSLSVAPVEIAAEYPPGFPPRPTTELWVDGQWVDISADVRATSDVTIRRGRADEAARADPAALSLVLNNRHGRYSPRNPLSPYYGKLHRNTPIRVRVGTPPTPGLVQLADSFGRTVSGGWGTPDVGPAWFNTGAAYSVADGAGQIRVATVNTSVRQYSAAPLPADLDATYAVSIDQVPRGASTGAVYAQVHLRDTAESHYVALNLGFRVDSGGGVRVAPDITAAGRQVTLPGIPVPGIVYTPGQWIRVRAQAIGPLVRIRVWVDGTPEPDEWHAQGWVPDITAPGNLAVVGAVTSGASGTTLPVTVRIRDLEVREPTPTDDGVRFTGEVSAWPPRWDVSDSDVWVPIQAAGILRRLGQGQAPLRSALRRGVPARLPVAYWPLEDGSAATQAAAATPGTPPLNARGLQFAEDDSLVSSGPVPVIGEQGGRITHTALAGPVTSSWEVFAFYRWDRPTQEWTGLRRFFSVQATTFRMDLNVFWSSSRPALQWEARDLDGALLGADSIFIDTGDITFFGAWRVFRLRAVQSGSSIAGRIDRLDPNTFDSWGATYSITGTVGRVTGVATEWPAEMRGMSIGHISVWATEQVRELLNPARGWAGETARDRLARLATDSGVPIEITGAADEPLGAEPTGTLLEIIGQAQDADLGAPGEARDGLTLTYRGRDQLYNQPVALTLDYRDGVISAPFEPVEDDQATRNRVEVKRLDGSSYEAVDLDGPLGVNAVGEYDESVTINLATDAQTATHAGWRLHLGTVDEARWPTIHLNLANPRLRGLIPQIAALDAGSRIRILNPPHWAQGQALDLIVQGYEERINVYAWDLTLTCTPASPWTVGEIATGDTLPAPPVAGGAAVADNAPATVTAAGTLPGDVLVVAQLWDWGTTETLPASPVCPTLGAWEELTTAPGPGEDAPQVRVWATTVATAGVHQIQVTTGTATGSPDNHAQLHLIRGTTQAELVAASAVGYTQTPHHPAPSVVMPAAGVLLCGHLVTAAYATYTPPPGMTRSAADVSGASSRSMLTHQVIPGPGPTGTRTAVASPADEATRWFAAYSVGVPVPVVRHPSADPDRVDTDGSVLAAPVDEDDQVLLVDSIAGPGWTTDPDDMPVDLAVGGEIVRAGAVAPGLVDTFGRAASDTWGAADTGQTWTEEGGLPSDRLVSGGAGWLRMPTGAFRLQTLPVVTSGAEVLVSVATSQTATGAAISPAVLLRYVSSAQHYRVHLRFNPGGTLALSLFVTGVGTIAVAPVAGAYAAQTQVMVRARVVGQRVQARAWLADTVEPAHWQIDRTVTAGRIDSGRVGLFGELFGGNTNTNPVLLFRAFETVTPQRMTVERAVNDIRKGHAAGTDIRLAQPTITAL